jgi:SAM-dependent methyltransferase
MNAMVLKNYGKVLGMDIAPEALKLAKRRGLSQLVRSDMNAAIPCKDNTFDVVTCLDVLEHLNDDRKAMKEVFRICKPGRFVIITVPAFDIQWSPHDVALHHIRRYTRTLLLKTITGLDFKILKSSYYNTILFFPVLAVRKLKNLFIKEKKDSKSDFFIPLPGWLNRFLTSIIKTEIRFLKKCSFPFGISLFLVLRKDD